MNKAEKDAAKLVEELKAKHGKVYTVTLPLGNDTDEKTTFYLREMDREVYKSVSKLIDKDELTGTESMIKSLWVGGDSVESLSFYTLRSASNTLGDMIAVKSGVLKKN